MQSERGLEGHLKRLLVFRVVMATTLLMVAVSVEAVSETLVRVNPLYFCIVAAYGLALAHAVALRFLGPRKTLVHLQVAGDLLIVTALVYVAGGSRGGFMLLYPLAVLAGASLLARTGSVVLAVAASACYAGILAAVRLGVVPPLGLAEVAYLPATALYYSVLLTLVACGAVALVGSYFSESLRVAGVRLQEAHVEVADLRGLNQLIVSSIHSGLALTDSHGRILHVNEFGAQILGQPAAAIRGRPVREVLGSPFLEPTALEARAVSDSLARLELSYARPEGAVLHLGLSVTPLAGARVSRGWLLVFQDLTEIKRLEQEVRIKEKLAAVGEMTAQLAHEIRNPLGSISGSAQVLMGEANMSPAQERLLAIITRESKRLSETLNRFLFSARAEPVPRAPVDVAPLVEQAVTLLRHGPEVKPVHTVELKIGEGPHVCLADPDQITQVLWNLTRNALEAMPDGGVLQVELAVDRDDLVLRVRDEGRGIGQDEQRRFFEPFPAGSSTGSGLGLAIVYRIVREHRGDIRVRSVPRRGTEVEVRLPRVSVSLTASGGPVASFLP